MKKRPNIIIFNPDEMRADTLAHLGNAAAVTPNLDAFAAKDAVSFRNAFCQSPVCVPSRCSFMTGLYPHTKGHRTMSHLLREGETSLLKELKESGYYVWSNARNDLVAGQIPGLVESHVTEMYYGGNCRPAPGAENPNLRGSLGSKNFYSFYQGKLKLDEDGKNYSTDDEDVDAAIQRILHPLDDRPLCVFLGLNFPHPPYRVEDPYFSAIDRTKLSSKIPVDSLEGKAVIEALVRKAQAMESYTETDWDELRATYLGMCMKIDEQFERVCDALKEVKEYDNTAIFFLSDHGDYTGDYGISEKMQNCFEDCLVRVPLLIKPPAGTELDAGITDSIAELVDFYATALDFAGIQSSHSHFGHSLRPVLAKRSTPGREYACCEGGRLASEIHCDEFHDTQDRISESHIYWPRISVQRDSKAHLKGTMLRTAEYKYVHRAGGQDEFYALEADPCEERNRIDAPEYAAEITRLRLLLLDWYQNTCDIVPYDHDSRFSPDMVWSKCKSLCPKGYEEEVKAKIGEGASVFDIMNYCKSIPLD